MANIANIVIGNGATPVANLTFTPQTPQVGDTPAEWYERSASSPLGYRKITLSVAFRSTGVSKVRLKVSDPVLATFGANCCVDQNTPQVSYTDIADLTFSVPSSATLANRKDILAFVKNILGQKVMTDAVESLEGAW